MCAWRPSATVATVRSTVLIVDDHAAFRASARALLESEGFQVVGEAADGASVAEAVERLRPAIVLLDIQLPDVDGFEVAARLPPGGPVVVLTSTRSVSAFRRRLASTGLPFIAKGELSGKALAAAAS
jgi:DNA-binding NarL/FixJ family response regulator